MERLRQDHALALADEQHARQLVEVEARHLQARLDERVVYIEGLQRALAALTSGVGPARPSPQPAPPF
ncbi:hypothetical protein [Streptomyces sp. NPDC050388]|uniref:hypothetical protein n=1 Tax=Streptomyces sp. NPDC050388 TaxID=3155781 RepID=UPI003431DB21